MFAKCVLVTTVAGGDDDDTLRTRLLQHVAQKSQQLLASVDAEKLRQDAAMHERMQRLKAEREVARAKIASAIAAAESGDVTTAAAAAADAAAAAGDSAVMVSLDSGETDEEKRQKLIQQLQVRMIVKPAVAWYRFRWRTVGVGQLHHWSI